MFSQHQQLLCDWICRHTTSRIKVLEGPLTYYGSAEVHFVTVVVMAALERGVTVQDDGRQVSTRVGVGVFGVFILFR